MNPMRCSLLALAVLLLPRPAAAESPVVFGLSLRGGLNHLGGDFGADFRNGTIGDFAISGIEDRVSGDLYFHVQEHRASGQRDAAASAQTGQPTKVRYVGGGGGLRLRYSYPGLDHPASAYGEAGAGLYFGGLSSEYGGSRHDGPTNFGVDGGIGAGLSVQVHRALSVTLGGELHQAYTSTHPVSSAGATLGVVMLMR